MKHLCSFKSAILVFLLGLLTACGQPMPSNTSKVSIAPAGGEVPYVVAERYMRTGHKPVTAAEFENNPFKNFDNTGARDIVVNLTGMSVGLDNLSLERFTKIVRGKDREVKREWRDCPANFVTVPQNLKWFSRDRYQTAYGTEQCLWLKGPGDRDFKAVFSLGCHNPIGAEITRIVRNLAEGGTLEIIKRPPPVTEPPVEETCEDRGDCPKPPQPPVPPAEGCAGNPGNNKCVGKATEDPTGGKKPHFETSGSGGTGSGSTGMSSTSQEGGTGPHEGSDTKTSKATGGSSTNVNDGGQKESPGRSANAPGQNKGS